MFGSFPVPPFDFFGNLIHENLFKMNFHCIKCIKTYQREQVNKFSQQFLVAKYRKNNFSTVFFEVLRRGWETGKEPNVLQNNRT